MEWIEGYARMGVAFAMPLTDRLGDACRAWPGERRDAALNPVP
jgi:hypothetical protein